LNNLAAQAKLGNYKAATLWMGMSHASHLWSTDLMPAVGMFLSWLAAAVDNTPNKTAAQIHFYCQH